MLPSLRTQESHRTNATLPNDGISSIFRFDVQATDSALADEIFVNPVRCDSQQFRDFLNSQNIAHSFSVSPQWQRSETRLARASLKLRLCFCGYLRLFTALLRFAYRSDVVNYENSRNPMIRRQNFSYTAVVQRGSIGRSQEHGTSAIGSPKSARTDSRAVAWCEAPRTCQR